MSKTGELVKYGVAIAAASVAFAGETAGSADAHSRPNHHVERKHTPSFVQRIASKILEQTGNTPGRLPNSHTFEKQLTTTQLGIMSVSATYKVGPNHNPIPRSVHAGGFHIEAGTADAVHVGTSVPDISVDYTNFGDSKNPDYFKRLVVPVTGSTTEYMQYDLFNRKATIGKYVLGSGTPLCEVVTTDHTAVSELLGTFRHDARVLEAEAASGQLMAVQPVAESIPTPNC